MKQYGLIGRKLGHSFSKAFFTEKFSREGSDSEYVNFEMPSVVDPEKGLLAVIESHPFLSGLNVTIPYKTDVIPLLDELDETAAEIGAVNTIKITRQEGRLELKGYNTDLLGFLSMLDSFINPSTKKTALVLGTGGASKAVVYGLKKRGFKVIKVSRHEGDDVTTYDELRISPEIIDECGVVVNCTPLGMWPDVDSCPDIPYDRLNASHILIDLVYNPDPTRFMKEGAKHGAVTCSGRKMLEEQALASYRIWNSI